MNYTKEANVMKELRMKKLILSITFLLIALIGNAQISGKSIPELRREAAPTFQYSNIPAFQYSFPPILRFSSFKYDKIDSKPSVPIIYSYHELAFFCKVEVKLEKAVKLPIKFRLGDVDYVDWLEGKRE